MKKGIIVCLSTIVLVGCLTACDGSSSGYDTNGGYDYYDDAGNGYNDEDVDWDADGGEAHGWDEAVNDYNRQNYGW